MSWAQKPEDVQGGKAWHDWRSKGLGASDAPIIMEVSPWSTPFKLWELKTGRKLPDEAGFAAKRGQALEPIARKKYEELHKFAFPPRTFEAGIFRASMDGWNDELHCGLEIKCPGREDHERAKQKEIPEKYFWQIQHQFFVTGAKWIDYFSYFVEKDGDKYDGDCEKIRCYPDKEAINKYVERAEKFWTLVTNDTPPPIGDRDFHEVKQGELVRIAERFELATQEFNVAKQRLELVKEEFIEHCKQKGWNRVKCQRTRMTEVTRKGNVDYSKVKELKGIDLEPYRKKETTYFKIDLVDSKD